MTKPTETWVNPTRDSDHPESDLALVCPNKCKKPKLRKVKKYGYRDRVLVKKNRTVRKNAHIKSVSVTIKTQEETIETAPELKQDHENHIYMDVEELKRKILYSEPEDIVEELIAPNKGLFVTEDHIEIIRKTVSKATGIEIKEDEILIVGSAKIGYGLFEKKRKEQPTLPAFRQFDGESDIDIAFASPDLYDCIWNELATYARAKTMMPYRMQSLGDYMVYGWIRPDHIPREIRLRTYDSWSDAIRRLATSPEFGRRKLSGALYRNMDFLKKYQIRGIAQCKKKLETP